MSEATLRERVDGVHNVLLVERTPAASERVDSLFGSAGHGENVVIVSYERPVDEWLREREPDARPARLGYVRVSDESPASGADGATGGTWLVDAAVDPADPARLGLLVGEYLTNWALHEEPTVVRFDSLTGLFDHVSVERGFRFLHTLTSHVRAADAAAWFRLDARACDRETLLTVRLLFDAVVEVTDDDASVDPR